MVMSTLEEPQAEGKSGSILRVEGLRTHQSQTRPWEAGAIRQGSLEEAACGR